jgi:hypothetical protein
MSTSETNRDPLCRDVEERMTEVLDGTASRELTDHIADCDSCRDTRYEAERAANIVTKAGADFVADAGFEDRILARIDVDKLPAPTGAVPRSLTSAPSSNVTSNVTSSSSSITSSKPVPATRTEAPASVEKISERQVIESARTELAAPARHDTLVSEGSNRARRANRVLRMKRVRRDQPARWSMLQLLHEPSRCRKNQPLASARRPRRRKLPRNLSRRPGPR